MTNEPIPPNFPDDEGSRPESVPGLANEAAERSLLASVLTSETAFDEAAEVVEAESFASKRNRVIFEELSRLAAKGRSFDIGILASSLEARGLLSRAGGTAYLEELARLPRGKASDYAKTVANLAARRGIVRFASDAQSRALRPNGEKLRDLIDELQSKVFALSPTAGNARGGFRNASTIGRDVFEEIARRGFHAERGEVNGALTGIAALDEVLGGFKPGELIVLAARPAMGKTSFAVNIAENVLFGTNAPVAVFSLEMTDKQLFSRLAASVASVPMKKFHRGEMTDAEWKAMSDAWTMCESRALYIDDTPFVTVENVRSKLRQLEKRVGKLGLVVIDYLQLMSPTHGRFAASQNRASEIAEITRGLKTLAKEIGTPILLLSQLNRDCEKRGDRPKVSDLKESGAIEQDADAVLLLYRESVNFPEAAEDPERKDLTEIIVGKVRNPAADTRTVVVRFDAEKTRFRSR